MEQPGMCRAWDELHTQKSYCYGWKPVARPAEPRKHQPRWRWEVFVEERLGNCDLRSNYANSLHNTPHVRRENCVGWRVEEKLTAPAEYTCPRCESNVSTHICMGVAGETKLTEWDFDIPRDNRFNGPFPRPAPAVAGETKPVSIPGCDTCGRQLGMWKPRPNVNTWVCCNPSCEKCHESFQAPKDKNHVDVCAVSVSHSDSMEESAKNKKVTSLAPVVAAPAEGKQYRPLPECRRALAEDVEQRLRDGFGRPNSLTDTWEKRVGIVKSALIAYENVVRASILPPAATVSSDLEGKLK